MKQIIATDLDGTLLNSQQKVSTKDYQTLIDLKEQGATRIIATGRNLYSLKKVISDDFPIDFVVFSSGAGIIDWRQKKLLHTFSIPYDEIQCTISELLPYQLDFTLHLAVPKNHHMLHYRTDNTKNDLYNYTLNYADYVKPFEKDSIPKEASQFVVFLDQNKVLFDDLQQKFHYLKCILATSPIDHQSLWMELFHPDVSKWNGIDYLLKNQIKSEAKITCIGNDYNDRDMLTHAHKSYVVANAVDELKQKYCTVASNNQSGFTEAVLKTLAST